MATNQKQASVARTIMFRSKGLGYMAFLNASTGDLVQQYDDDGAYYPSITSNDPVRVMFTATSSRQVGVITPDSITYKVGGIELAFNSSGVCTTTTSNANQYFKKDGADLVIIGNIAAFLNKTSSIIEAIAKKGTDDLYACCPVNISKYQGGRVGKVSIAPADAKNFTLTSQTDTVKLKAGVLKKTGWIYNSTAYAYLWEIADPSQPSGWRQLSVGSGNDGTITVHASEVNTFANIRCTVYATPLGSTTPPTGAQIAGNLVPQSLIVGSDCVGVLDASDPLDIICSVKINKTGTGAEVDADIEELDDTMPSTAYLIYSPTLVKRGELTSVGSTTWLTGLLTDPAGIVTKNIIPSSGKYKVTVADISASYGEHTLVMTGKLN